MRIYDYLCLDEDEVEAANEKKKQYKPAMTLEVSGAERWWPTSDLI